MSKKAINWDEVKQGAYFSATIQGTECKGRIRKKKYSKDFTEIYLCQNEMNGSTVNNLFGFKNSWTISNGNPTQIKCHDVKKLVIHDRKPKGHPSPVAPPVVVLNDEYAVEIFKHQVRVLPDKVPVSLAEIKRTLKAMNSVAEGKKNVVEIPLGETYETDVIYHNKVIVGCQTFTKKTIEKVLAKMDSAKV